MPVDRVGDEPNRARTITLNSNVQTFKDAIGGLDSDDFYRFSFRSTASINLSLTGLIANADLRLLDSQRNIVASSTKNSTDSESIVRTLNAGTYYIQVLSGDVENQTVYQLKASTASDPGGTLATARTISFSGGKATVQDVVGSDAFASDNIDTYRFQVRDRTNFILDGESFSSSPILVSLLNSGGGLLAQRNFRFPFEDEVNITLNPGTYYLQTQSLGNPTPYKLSLATSPDPGGTLATARRITPTAAGISLSDSVSENDDPIDYYRFSVNQTTTVGVTLFPQLRVGTFDLSVLNSQGNAITPTSFAVDDAFEVVIQNYYTLATGTYYIRVADPGGIDPAGAYDLSVVATPDPGNTLARALSIDSQSFNRGNPFKVEDAVNSLNDPNDYYRFTLNRQGNFDLSLTPGVSFLPPAFDSNVEVQLLNSVGNVVASSTNPGDSSEFIRTFLKAGTYYVRVFNSGIEGAAYELDFQFTSDVGDTLSTARSLALTSAGISVNETLNPGAGDTFDYYRVNVGSLSTFGLTLLNDNVNGDLLDSRGRVIQSDLGSFDRGFITTLATGTYYLRFSAGSATEYAFNLFGAPDAGGALRSARTITLINNEFRGVDFTTPTDADYYRFNLPTRSNINLVANDLRSSSPSVGFEILNDRGQVILSNQSSGPGGLPFGDPNGVVDTLNAGIYYIRFFSASGGSVGYSFNLAATPEAGNTVNTALNLNLRNPSTFPRLDFITDSDPVDIYKFTLSTDNNISLLLNSTAGNVDLQLFTRTGELIGSSTNSSSLEDSILTALSAGTYYVRVYQPVAGEEASYQLFISEIV
jgi:hypothetical protein